MGIAMLAQQAGGADLGNLWSALGAGGIVAGAFWRWHEASEKRHAVVEDALNKRLDELTDRVIKIAETSGQVARGVADVASEPEPNLRAQMERIERLLEER